MRATSPILLLDYHVLLDDGPLYDHWDSEVLMPLDKLNLVEMTDTGIRPCKAFDYLEHNFRGAQKLPVNRKDAYNYLDKIHRDIIRVCEFNVKSHG
ncbi:hypothetical protein OROHE_005516 [Orobanche hederae]